MTSEALYYYPYYVSVQRRRSQKHKHQRATDSSLSTDELMETATFKKFYSIIDTILESTEDLDMGALNGK